MLPDHEGNMIQAVACWNAFFEYLAHQHFLAGLLNRVRVRDDDPTGRY